MTDVPLPGIEHVVVVMFENRSFDNVLGGLYPERTEKKEFFGVKPSYWNPLNPTVKDSEKVFVWQAAAGLEGMVMPYPDPGEAFSDMNQQIFGNGSQTSLQDGHEPPMNGFVWNYLKRRPGCWPCDKRRDASSAGSAGRRGAVGASTGSEAPACSWGPLNSRPAHLSGAARSSGLAASCRRRIVFRGSSN